MFSLPFSSLVFFSLSTAFCACFNFIFISLMVLPSAPFLKSAVSGFLSSLLYLVLYFLRFLSSSISLSSFTEVISLPKNKIKACHNFYLHGHLFCRLLVNFAALFHNFIFFPHVYLCVESVPVSFATHC